MSINVYSDINVYSISIGTSKSKRGRGKSRSLALSKVKNSGDLLPIQICRYSGIALGKWSDKFTSELGIITRQFAPQKVPKWGHISKDEKANLIAYMRVSDTNITMIFTVA